MELIEVEMFLRNSQCHGRYISQNVSRAHVTEVMQAEMVWVMILSYLPTLDFDAHHIALCTLTVKIIVKYDVQFH